MNLTGGTQVAPINDGRVTMVANKSARTWATLCHVSAFCVLLGIPFGNILGPLLVWLVKRKSISFVSAHGTEAINFQISMTLYAVGGVLFALLTGNKAVLLLIGMYNLVLVVIATQKAWTGQDYSYPFKISFLGDQGTTWFREPK